MPLPADFLWLHLGRPDPIILPILVAATTYILQKMTMMPATDERQRAQNSMMNLMMPLHLRLDHDQPAQRARTILRAV